MFKKFREIIVEESDVMLVLKVIGDTLGYFDGQVGKCGWADEPTKWFITFEISDAKYGKICNGLGKFGLFELHVSQKGKERIYYVRKGA